MASLIELTNPEWVLVRDLFDPPYWRGAPARHGRETVLTRLRLLPP
jgi:hypothetical protein